MYIYIYLKILHLHTIQTRMYPPLQLNVNLLTSCDALVVDATVLRSIHRADWMTVQNTDIYPSRIYEDLSKYKSDWIVSGF